MKLSIRRRLLLSNLATLAFVAVIGGIGFQAVRTLNGATDAISSNGVAMRNQLQTDMMHDALRGDVLAALLAAGASDAAASSQAIKDANEHVELFRSRLAEMGRNTSDAALRQAMAKVGPDADAYIASAATLVTLAARDKDAAQASFPAFMQQFRKLEDSMSALSELIEANSQRSGVAADQVASESR